MPEETTLAVAQMGATQDVAHNLVHVVDVLAGAATQGVGLLILPECVLSG